MSINRRSAAGLKRRCFQWLYAVLVLAASTILTVGFAHAQDIVLGQSAALSGPAQELGREMQLGAKRISTK